MPADRHKLMCNLGLLACSMILKIGIQCSFNVDKLILASCRVGSHLKNWRWSTPNFKEKPRKMGTSNSTASVVASHT